ncbi:hypothetical protein [Clostridium hydrogenum]|uniref:hypothetical protein n=1 Tax=Clostridium hydrogenum TaxID=2855764 RepID=UPI001F160C92|nr:hypothetical protein [Clostridium hydrogenum]
MNHAVVLVLIYSALVVLIIGISYIIYLFKEKDVELQEDYYGLNFNVFHTIKKEEYNEKIIKKILKIIKSSINFVENNYKLEKNYLKENKALEISKGEIKKLNLKSKIDDESIRALIRLGCVFMISDNK